MEVFYKKAHYPNYAPSGCCMCPPQQVVIPGDNRFVPAFTTINKGDSIIWVNMDNNSHTITSTSDSNPNVDVIIPSGQSFSLNFNTSGQFVYYCKYHAHLDNFGQPNAIGFTNVSGGTGTLGLGIGTTGISTMGTTGPVPVPNGINYGTPMMGVVSVMDKRK